MRIYPRGLRQHTLWGWRYWSVPDLFQPTDASGPATTGLPGDPSFGNLQQGYLESSNVDPVREITELISAQRAYEMKSKVIQAADDMAGVVSKGIR